MGAAQHIPNTLGALGVWFCKHVFKRCPAYSRCQSTTYVVVPPTNIRSFNSPAHHPNVYLAYTATSVSHARQCSHDPRQSHAPNSRRSMSRASFWLTRLPAQASMQLRLRRRNGSSFSASRRARNRSRSHTVWRSFAAALTRRCPWGSVSLGASSSLSGCRQTVIRMRQSSRECKPKLPPVPVIDDVTQPGPH